MRKYLALAVLLLLSGCYGGGRRSRTAGVYTSERGWTKTGPTQYIKPNAYGQGVASDQFGRPVTTTAKW